MVVSADIELLSTLVEDAVSDPVVLLEPSGSDEVIVADDVSIAVELDARVVVAVEVTSVALALVSSDTDEGLPLTEVVEVVEAVEAVEVVAVADGCSDALEVPELLVDEVLEVCASVPTSGDEVDPFEQAQAIKGDHSK